MDDLARGYVSEVTSIVRRVIGGAHKSLICGVATSDLVLSCAIGLGVRICSDGTVSQTNDLTESYLAPGRIDLNCS